MTQARVIVYSFAIAPDLPPVVGAPSYDVLARQLPRLVVAGLNRDRDRGVRFFPLLGPRDGRRQFFTVPELLTPDQLATIHGQPGPNALLVDGRIESGAVHLRFHDAETLRPVLDERVGLDPLDPRPVAARLLFELSGHLGWQGPLPELPPYGQPDISYDLVARDDLLSLEAGFVREGENRWLKAITTLVERRIDAPCVQQLLLDICRRLAAAGGAEAEVGGLLVRAAAAVDDTHFLGGVAGVLQQVGHGAAAAGVFDRLVGRTLEDAAVVERVASHLFRAGRLEEGRRELERAVAAGLDSPRVLGQLLVYLQRLGELEDRAEIADRLLDREDLPASIGRVLAAELVELERLDDALLVATRCLEAAPEHAGLWLELARAHLHRDESEPAQRALDLAAVHGGDGPVAKEAVRLRRYVERPRVLAELRRLDRAVSVGDLDEAHLLARQLTEDEPQLAEAWLFLGIVEQRREQPEAATPALRRALELDPQLGEAHNRLGILLVGAGSHEVGYRHLQQAIRLMPRDSGPRIHIAQACSYLGKHDEGLVHLAAAEQLGGDARMIDSVRRTFFGDVA